MKCSFVAVLTTIICIVTASPVFSDPVSELNATLTQDGVFYMRAPSFVGRDSGIYEMGGAGSEVIVLSRTSFTDRMAGVPQDYWYLVMYRHCGAEITGYIHGSALTVDPARSVPEFDPPGAAPTPVVPAFERLTARASIDKECIRTPGMITVPVGSRAVRFRLNYFGGGVTRCSEGPSPALDGFLVTPVSGAGGPLFGFEYPEDSGPNEFDSVRDGFFSLDLGPGVYRVEVSGGASLSLMITYDLVEAR